MTEKKKKINKRYINKLERFIEKSEETSKYSIERFDLLLISLSTTALVLSIGFVKDLIPNFKEIDTSYLKFSWLLLSLSLILNLISQVTGYFANEYSISVTKNIIKIERGKKESENQKTFIWWETFLSDTTMILNGICLFSFIIGSIILIKFISTNI
jgi:hypothetical protein